MFQNLFNYGDLSGFMTQIKFSGSQMEGTKNYFKLF